VVLVDCSRLTFGRQAAVRGFATGYSDKERETVRGVKGMNLMRIDDYSAEEFKAMLAMSRHIKQLYNEEKIPQALRSKSVATIFQKRSTRTRVSTETGMYLMGGKSLFLSSEDIQLGVNESIRDTACVLSNFNSLILARVHGHEIVSQIGEHASVPVINALSDMHHPLQILADFMTIQEHFGVENVAGKTLVWVGDGNNVLHDIMLAAPMVGVNVSICTPNGHEPDTSIIKKTQQLCDQHGTSLKMGNDPVTALEGANIVVTDTWVSMGQEAEAKARMKAFEGYKITEELMAKGKASDDWIFLHCLPRHQEEVSDDVFYSKRSLVFPEAQNRMFTVMAVMASQLGETF